MAFAPDCKRLLTAGADGCVFVWKLSAQLTDATLARERELRHASAPARAAHSGIDRPLAVAAVPPCAVQHLPPRWSLAGGDNAISLAVVGAEPQSAAPQLPAPQSRSSYDVYGSDVPRRFPVLSHATSHTGGSAAPVAAECLRPAGDARRHGPAEDSRCSATQISMHEGPPAAPVAVHSSPAPVSPAHAVARAVYAPGHATEDASGIDTRSDDARKARAALALLLRRAQGQPRLPAIAPPSSLPPGPLVWTGENSVGALLLGSGAGARGNRLDAQTLGQDSGTRDAVHADESIGGPATSSNVADARVATSIVDGAVCDADDAMTAPAATAFIADVVDELMLSPDAAAAVQLEEHDFGMTKGGALDAGVAAPHEDAASSAFSDVTTTGGTGVVEGVAPPPLPYISTGPSSPPISSAGANAGDCLALPAAQTAAGEFEADTGVADGGALAEGPVQGNVTIAVPKALSPTAAAAVVARTSPPPAELAAAWPSADQPFAGGSTVWAATGGTLQSMLDADDVELRWLPDDTTGAYALARGGTATPAPVASLSGPPACASQGADVSAAGAGVDIEEVIVECPDGPHHAGAAGSAGTGGAGTAGPTPIEEALPQPSDPALTIEHGEGAALVLAAGRVASLNRASDSPPRYTTAAALLHEWRDDGADAGARLAIPAPLLSSSLDVSYSFDADSEAPGPMLPPMGATARDDGHADIGAGIAIGVTAAGTESTLLNDADAAASLAATARPAFPHDACEAAWGTRAGRATSEGGASGVAVAGAADVDTLATLDNIGIAPPSAAHTGFLPDHDDHNTKLQDTGPPPGPTRVSTSEPEAELAQPDSQMHSGDSAGPQHELAQSRGTSSDLEDGVPRGAPRSPAPLAASSLFCTSPVAASPVGGADQSSQVVASPASVEASLDCLDNAVQMMLRMHAVLKLRVATQSQAERGNCAQQAATTGAGSERNSCESSDAAAAFALLRELEDRMSAAAGSLLSSLRP